METKRINSSLPSSSNVGSKGGSEVSKESVDEPETKGMKMISRRVLALARRDWIPIYLINAWQILQSYHYTCVTFYKPKRVVCVAYYGFVLECHTDDRLVFFSNGTNMFELEVFHEVAIRLYGTRWYHAAMLFHFCEVCNKYFVVWEYVLVYGGRRSFCGFKCLAVAILAEEATRAMNDHHFCNYFLPRYEVDENEKEEEEEDEMEDVFYIREV